MFCHWQSVHLSLNPIKRQEVPRDVRHLVDLAVPELFIVYLQLIMSSLFLSFSGSDLNLVESRGYWTKGRKDEEGGRKGGGRERR